MIEVATTQVRGAVSKFRAWVQNNPWPFFLLAVSSIVFLAVMIQTIRAGNMGFRERSFWDWMELLIIPLVLVGGGFLLNREQRQNELDIERNKEEEKALQGYLDAMTALLLSEKSLRTSKVGDPVRSVAITRTLSILSSLKDGKRKARIVNFLYGTDVIKSIVSLHHTTSDKTPFKKIDTIVDLKTADLSGARLSESILVRANLRRIDAREAQLEGANLRRTDLRRANLSGANLCEANLSGADLSGADLSGADLSGANLGRAKLRGGNLDGANLNAAILSGADLSGADLSGADLSGVELGGVDLGGVMFSNDTKWPKGSHHPKNPRQYTSSESEEQRFNRPQSDTNWPHRVS